MSEQSGQQPPPLPRGGDFGMPGAQTTDGSQRAPAAAEAIGGAATSPAIAAAPSDPQPYPLLVSDPPRIGDFWLDARLVAREAGVVFVAHADDEPAVMVLVLAEGAAHDPAARDRLAGEVNKLHAESVVARGGDGQDGGRLGHKYRSEADDPVAAGDRPTAPWVALAYDGSPEAVAEADRLLRSVDLSSTPMLGSPAGPDYRLHWLDNSRPGAWRLWPASWPGRHDRAGWVPIATSWLLTIWLGALALLIAVLLFQNSPPESPQPPVPTEQSASSGEGTPDQSDQQSASPSEGTESGSPQTEASSPGEDGSPSREPSMGTGGEGTATDTQPPPPVNTKL